MSLYNQIVFYLLCFELVTFFLLSIPLPHKARRNVYSVVKKSPIFGKIHYALQITFIFIGVLFVDSVNHVAKVHKEGHSAHQGYVNKTDDSGYRGDLRSETDWRTRKFLAERNLYLTGFTLFLSLVLSQVYSLNLKLLDAEAKGPVPELAAAKAEAEAAPAVNEAKKAN